MINLWCRRCGICCWLIYNNPATQVCSDLLDISASASGSIASLTTSQGSTGIDLLQYSRRWYDFSSCSSSDGWYVQCLHFQLSQPVHFITLDISFPQPPGAFFFSDSRSFRLFQPLLLIWLLGIPAAVVLLSPHKVKVFSRFFSAKLEAVSSSLFSIWFEVLFVVDLFGEEILFSLSKLEKGGVRGPNIDEDMTIRIYL